MSILISLVVVCLVLAGLWHFKETIMFWFITPKKPFDKTLPPPKPDYSDPESWAAFPGTNGPAERVPEGVPSIPEQDRTADVFFVHATSFISAKGWNADVSDDKTNAVTDAFNMAGQAAAFNKAGRIYAPRYRQATLAAMANWNETTEQVVETSYEDIAAAFEYFIGNIAPDSPIILAAHSQGCCHLLRLIIEEVQGRALASRIVAIYLPGVWLPKDYVETVLSDFPVASAPDQTGCILCWDTYLDGSDGRKENEGAIGYWTGGKYEMFEPRKLCPISPVSGCSENSNIAAHQGAVAPVATSLPSAQKNGGGTGDLPLSPPVGSQVSTRITENGLFVSKAKDKRFSRAMPGSGSLHPLDINLFFVDIREDAARRAKAFCNT